MKSSMRIIRSLPPAPEPTREYRNPRLDAFGCPITNPSPVKGFGSEQVQEKVRAYCEQRSKAAAEKRERVKELELQGRTEDEIASAVGYSIKTIRNILGSLRSAGYDIPYENGRKRRCRE